MKNTVITRILILICFFTILTFLISAKLTANLLQETKIPTEFSRLIFSTLDSMLLKQGFNYKTYLKNTKTENVYIWKYTRSNIVGSIQNTIDEGVIPEDINISISLPVKFVHRIAVSNKYKSLEQIIAQNIKKSFSKISNEINKQKTSDNPKNFEYNYNLEIDNESGAYLVLLQNISFNTTFNHPLSEVIPVVYDIQKNQLVQLQDFFTQESNFNTFFNTNIISYIKNSLVNTYLLQDVSQTNTSTNNAVVDDLFSDKQSTEENKNSKIETKKRQMPNQELLKNIDDELKKLNSTNVKFSLDVENKKITEIVFYFNQLEILPSSYGVQKVVYPVACDIKKLKTICRKR